METVRGQPQNSDRQHRPDNCPECVEGLTQPETGSPEFDRCDISNQRITRRTSDALADPVYETCRDKPADGSREGENRLCESSEAVSDHDKHLALADPVRNHT